MRRSKLSCFFFGGGEGSSVVKSKKDARCCHPCGDFVVKMSLLPAWQKKIYTFILARSCIITFVYMVTDLCHATLSRCRGENAQISRAKRGKCIFSIFQFFTFRCTCAETITSKVFLFFFPRQWLKEKFSGHYRGIGRPLISLFT